MSNFFHDLFSGNMDWLHPARKDLPPMKPQDAFDTQLCRALVLNRDELAAELLVLTFQSKRYQGAAEARIAELEAAMFEIMQIGPCDVPTYPEVYPRIQEIARAALARPEEAVVWNRG